MMQNAWNTYSACEKDAANAATYDPLKAASPTGGPCDAFKFDVAC